MRYHRTNGHSSATVCSQDSYDDIVLNDDDDRRTFSRPCEKDEEMATGDATRFFGVGGRPNWKRAGATSGREPAPESE